MRDILVVTPTFFPELIGTPHYVTDLVRWLGEEGWSVRVLTAQPFYPEFRRHEGYGLNTRHDRVGAAEVYRLPTIVPRNGRVRWRAVHEAHFLAQGLLAAARKAVARSDFVLSVSPGSPEAVLLGRSMTKPGGRHIALIHDIQTGLAKSLAMAGSPLLSAIRRFERYALDQADELHVLSAQMGCAVRELGVTTPITVSPVWATVSAPFGVPVPDCGPLVQYSGNLGRKQGVTQLIELARLMDEALPGERLLVRGAGAMRLLLEGDVRRSRLTNLDLEALVPHSGLGAALARSPIHVVPQQPGCADYVVPSKVINALAVGSVVVAGAPSRSALAVMAAESRAVRCVSPGDVAAMATAVEEFASNPNRLAIERHEARLLADSTFNRDRILKALVCQ